MTEQEYNAFWDHEKKVEKIIAAGNFGRMFTTGDVDKLARESEGTLILKGVKKQNIFLKIWRMVFIK